MAVEKEALLVVDVQKGLFKRKSRVYNEDILLENINYLIDKAGERDIPVIFIRHTNESILQENTDNWQVHPLLKAGSKDYYFNKNHSGMFEEEHIVKELKKLPVSTFIVTGLVAHGCVKAACLGAKAAGYDVILAEDAHSSFNKDAGKLIEEWNGKLRGEGIRVIPARDIFG